MIKVGINGFGRIGRLATRIMLQDPTFKVVSVNHPTINKKELKHLLSYDSDLKGYNKNKNTKILVSAPSKSLPMYIYGVNHKKYANETIISGSSCTTTCLAPLVQILHENYYIKNGLATTIHSVTASQNAVDKLKVGSRTGRTLLNNIIPSSTGAARSIGKVIPELAGVLNAIGVRVPVQNVSLLDLTVELEECIDITNILQELTHQSQYSYKNLLHVEENELVSSDFISSPYTTIIDASSCMKQGGLYKFMAWYDNEYGYASNLLRLAKYIT